MKNIIVGIDGGDGSKLASRRAAEVAEATGATLHFVTVVSKDETKVVGEGSERWYINSVEEAERMVNQFVATLRMQIAHQTHTVTGDPADGLLEKAGEVDADLIVVGNHRMQGLGRILGSVGQDVLHRTECDVLIVKTT